MLEAKLLPAADGLWRVPASIAHADLGWAHYADGFELLSPAGELLISMVLLHPHGAEQPLTRSTGPFALPADVGELIVRAHDSVHGHGGREIRMALPAEH